jgi:lysophospholipid acyltransferase (LPLAT)-like uncharacterized protein
MKRCLIAGLLVVLFGLTSVAQEKKQSDSAQKAGAESKASIVSTNKAAARETYTVIGYLEKRDRVVTIKSGPKGAVYTVATKDGKVLLENVTAEQLRAQAPEIHQLIKTGVASGDARVRVSAIRDASIR